MNTCRCGCDKPVAPNRRYVMGHDGAHRGRLAHELAEMTPALRHQTLKAVDNLIKKSNP